MTKWFKANPFEAVLVVLASLYTVYIFLGLTYLIYPDFESKYSPLYEYDHDAGIIAITIFSLILCFVFVGCFLALSFNKYRHSKRLLSIYLLAALTIGFLQWFELYYGSTFYYGEVRDKQGLMFPYLASLLLTLVIWKITYTTIRQRNIATKIIATLLTNGTLYFLWILVQEPWKLWQS